jgi:hypothetical protein
MSIPLDRLYHYIEDIAKDVYHNVLIYRFWPHGSKKIDDLLPLKSTNWISSVTFLQVYCNDQEPLHWELYNDCARTRTTSPWCTLLLKNSFKPVFNNLCETLGIYDKHILLHSEQRSSNCELYQKNNFVLAYYWSHAVIALDWFRYAQHIDQIKSVKKLFLIYNRAWSGTREYRLKFLELLVHAHLEKHCETTVAAVELDSNQHYSNYKFKNPVWKPKTALENYFPPNCTASHYSADFDLNDYERTNIEIVLETLFDDDRLHLTEKTLRPIACGQPFILLATSGSLEYLQGYGFKTFNHIWSEEYDSIQDPETRLNCVVKLMSEIANWDTDTRRLKLSQAQEIANYNRQYFFSKEFFTLIDNELRENLSSALVEVEETNTAKKWLDRQRELSTVDEIKKIISGLVPHPDYDSNPEFCAGITQENVEKVMAMAVKIAKSKEQ